MKLSSLITVVCLSIALLGTLAAGESNKESGGELPQKKQPEGPLLTKLEFPLRVREYFGIGVLSFMTMMANAAGIGGGGVIIPLITIFFSLPIKECVPLANFFGFLAALIRFMINYNQRHPRNIDRLVIDYEIVQLTMPMLYLGSLFGVRIGYLLNDVAIAVVLGVLLIYMEYKSFKKARRLWREETIQKELASKGLLPKQQDMGRSELVSSGVYYSKATPELKSIIKNEKSHFPSKRSLNNLATLVFLFVTSFLLRGKGQRHSNVRPVYGYIALALFIIYTIASTVYNAINIKHIHMIKRRDEYMYDPTDITYESNYNIVKLVSMSFVVGTLGGIVGIAGGIILNPMLLQMGLLPSVVAATNQYLALVSTIAVTTQFIMMGALNFQYAMFLGVFVAVSSAIGLVRVRKLVKKTGRQSIIVIILTIVLLICLLAIPLKFMVKKSR